MNPTLRFEPLAAVPAPGFSLRDDAASGSLLAALSQADAVEASGLMQAATRALLEWQLQAEAGSAPAFDEAMLRAELQVFVDWCVGREFGRSWTETQQGWWAHSCKALARNHAAQPQCALHREFTPRHLMQAIDDAPRNAPVAATVGPISYDLVSLLRDPFIAWEEEQELDWAIRYWEQARKSGLPIDTDFGSFWQQLEWTGLQRHLALLGCFSQLKHQDGQSAALEASLPRLFAFAIKVTTRYVELSPLTHLLQDLQGSLVQTGFTLR